MKVKCDFPLIVRFLPSSVSVLLALIVKVKMTFMFKAKSLDFTTKDTMTHEVHNKGVHKKGKVTCKSVLLCDCVLSGKVK